MRLTLEPGKTVAELFHCKNEFDHGTAGIPQPLSGHAHGNSGRIGNEHHGRDSSCHLFERYLFGFATHQLLVGLEGREHGVEILVASRVDQARKIQFHHGGMHLVAQLAQRHIAIARRILQYQFRHRLAQVGIGVIQALELEKVLEQGSPLALAGAHGEEHQNGVVSGARDLDTAAVEELGKNSRRDAPILHDPLRVHARHQDRDLGRIEHAVSVRDIRVLIAVPAFPCLQCPAARFRNEQSIRSAFQQVRLARLRISDLFWLKEPEEPAVAVGLRGSQAMGNRRHCFTKADGVLNRLVHQRMTRRFIHHGRRYIERSNQRIEGRCGAVHHEGFVELIKVQGSAIAELDVHHGTHGEGGQHLVRRLHREECGTVRHVIGHAHRIASAIQLVELGVGIPRLIEVDARNALRQLLDHLVYVVAEAIVGRVGHHRIRGRLCGGAGCERTAGDELPDRVGTEAP